ncbi:translocation/assembly module TamB domain-containing protein [Actibacterium sp. MT2.3-13A]|uniref:translocation/assembly module TamB domain-containing protein n=1 Tax=Actibacterium sp. MT2.3-13A TaxID=2828332 RepID=UPI001BA59C79|nr:translocation/assembly module TamB domain-containing protein [Actibacterium sp. MT2.3-13A]
MRFAALLTMILALAVPALAQEKPRDDRGFLQGLLEDNLSSAGREVRIEGFEGALSARATIEELTIADDTGVWLTLRDVTLDWSRRALLDGRLEVKELKAGEIVLPRLPAAPAAPEGEQAPARPFALPELPVSVNIARLAAERAVIGEAVFGQAAELSMVAALQLEGGEGQARLAVTRTDRPGTLTLDAGYANATGILALDMALSEGPEGIAATLMRLPGRPALELAARGTAPLSDYRAEITLATDGEPRLTGAVTLAAEGTPEAPGRRFAADLAGDMGPLFTPELRPFFGDSAAFALSGRTGPEGAVTLDTFTLRTAELDLSGALELAPGGMPQRFALGGRIGGRGAVRLPLPGPATWVDSALIDARFDAAKGEEWQAELSVTGLRRADIALDQARLRGAGTIRQAAPQAITARLDYALDGLTHADPDLARALGTSLAGEAALDWQAGGPLRLETLRAAGEGLSLQAQGTLGLQDEGLPAEGRVALSARDIARFAPLAGRDIAGAIEVTAEGRIALIGDAFELSAQLTGTGVRSGIAELDRITGGTLTLDTALWRDEGRLGLRRLSLDSPGLTARAAGGATPADAITFDARLANLGLLLPGLDGPLQASGQARPADGQTWEIALDATAPGGAGGGAAQLQLSGTVDPADENLPVVGRVTLSAEEIARFAALAGRPVAGKLEATAEGRAELRGSSFDLSARLRGSGLRSGMAELDRITGGEVTLETSLWRAEGRPGLRRLTLETPRLSASAEGGDTPADAIAFRAELADLGLLVPEFSGPVQAEGRARPAEDGTWDLALTASGPGGTSAAIEGLVAGDGATVDLTLSGTAPLGLANPYIAPRNVQGTARYDLRLQGAPALSALSGRVSAAGARLSAPTFNTALDPLDATIEIAAGRAQIAMTGEVRGGGRISVSGPVALSAPNEGDLTVTLQRVRVRDPLLYDTRVDGQIALSGPLTGAGRITGALSLEETELRIPADGIAEIGSLPGLRHANEPAAVHATRARAGLLETGDGPGGGPGLSLDLTIDAPNRIFVRGRGLDAELGGQLRLSGTTEDVIPSGLFELVRGRLDILGKRLELTEGRVDLQGAFDPYLRFVATTRADEVEIRILVEGLASDPEITFRSEPELPQEEVVSRLIFGRGLDTISPFQAARLAGAVATLAGRGGGGVVGKLREGFGLSDLDVTTTDTGATEVRAGKYLSENIYSEVVVDNEGESEIHLNLDLTPSTRLRGKLSSTGDTSLGVFFERDY